AAGASDNHRPRCCRCDETFEATGVPRVEGARSREGSYAVVDQSAQSLMGGGWTPRSVGWSRIRTPSQPRSSHMIRSLVATMLVSPALAAQVTTAQYDNARTGAYTAEHTLTPKTVASSRFGKTHVINVDG